MLKRQDMKYTANIPTNYKKLYFVYQIVNNEEN